jgi:hypothetical protein
MGMTGVRQGIGSQNGGSGIMMPSACTGMELTASRLIASKKPEKFRIRITASFSQPCFRLLYI